MITTLNVWSKDSTTRLCVRHPDLLRRENLTKLRIGAIIRTRLESLWINRRRRVQGKSRCRNWTYSRSKSTTSPWRQVMFRPLSKKPSTKKPKQKQHLSEIKRLSKSRSKKQLRIGTRLSSQHNSINSQTVVFITNDLTKVCSAQVRSPIGLRDQDTRRVTPFLTSCAVSSERIDRIQI